MNPKYLGPNRIGRAASYILTATLGFAGCASQSQPEQSSSAVETPNASRIPDENTQTHFEVAYPTGDRNSSTLLVEQMGPRQVRVNHPVNYQIKVTNLTNQPVRNVMLTSTNPKGFQTTAVSGSTTQPADNGQLAYSVGTLGPKESKILDVTGMGMAVGAVDTCYIAKCDPPTLCTAMEVINPTLAVAVRVPADADICQTLDYQYTVSNTGSGVARNVMLHEDLPEGLTTSDDKKVVDANVGDIPQGQSRQVTAHLKATRTGNFQGQATAKSEDDTAQGQSTTTAVHAPSLTVAIKGPAQDYVGKQVAYQVIVTNKGDAAARNAKLLLGRTGVGALLATGMDQSGQSSLGTLEPGASRTVNITASSEQGGTTGITANASADCASAAKESAQLQFMTIPALLLETVDEADPIRVGDNVVYDIKVTNQGTGPDTNVHVSAVIPDGERFITATGSSEGKVDGQNITFAPIPRLEAKQSVAWKVTLKAEKAADVSFKTSVTSDGIKTPAEKTEPTKLY